MTIRHVRAITTGLLTCGLATFAPANGRAQNAPGLPEEKTDITLSGCFLQQPVMGKENYVLVNPTVGAQASTPSATCSSTGNDPRVRLERIKKRNLNNVSLGQMVQVTGRLRRTKERRGDEAREMHVTDMQLVPVVAPRTATAIIIPVPTPAPAPEAPVAAAPTPEPAPAPVATTGVIEKKHHKRLPKSASSLPLIELLGLVACAGGLTLFAERRRRV